MFTPPFFDGIVGLMAIVIWIQREEPDVFDGVDRAVFEAVLPDRCRSWAVLVKPELTERFNPIRDLLDMGVADRLRGDVARIVQWTVEGYLRGQITTDRIDLVVSGVSKKILKLIELRRLKTQLEIRRFTGMPRLSA